MRTLRPLWGQRIQAARRAVDLTQVQLSAALGVTQQCVSRWEKGLAAPNDEVRPKLARILGVEIHVLLPYDTDNDGEGEAA